MKENLFILLHNVNSVNMVVEFTRIVLGFDFNNIIISKAEGSAALSGVPNAHKEVYKLGKNLLYLSNLEDVIDVINPDIIFLYVSKKYTDKVFESLEINKLIKENKRIIIGFSGQKTGFTKQDMDLGDIFTLNIPSDIGPLGALAIILNEILKSQ